MKVETFETFVVGNPPPSFGGRYFIFVKLVADDGTVGYGEVYTATFNPHVVARMIEDVCERHVVGHDPFHVEALWRNVYGRGYTSRPDLSLISVLSGIEIACWDLIGKAVDKPVYELLGGQVHERLRSYTYLHPSPTDSADAYTEKPRLQRPPTSRATSLRRSRARLHRGQIRSSRPLHRLRRPHAKP